MLSHKVFDWESINDKQWGTVQSDGCVGDNLLSNDNKISIPMTFCVLL